MKYPLKSMKDLTVVLNILTRTNNLLKPTLKTYRSSWSGTSNHTKPKKNVQNQNRATLCISVLQQAQQMCII